jgi:hypothetical protein
LEQHMISHLFWYELLVYMNIITYFILLHITKQDYITTNIQIEVEV